MLSFLKDVSSAAMVCAQKLVDRGTQYMTTGLWHNIECVRKVSMLYKTENGAKLVKSIISSSIAAYGNFVNSGTHSYYPKLIMPAGVFYVKDLEGPRTIGKDDSYAGAVMVEPTPGLLYYLITLDFASLYPSIMRTFNMCPTTLIPHKQRVQVARRLGRLIEQLGIKEDAAIWTRTDNWYVTGDAPTHISTVKEAIEIYESPDCPYDGATKEALKVDYDYLTDPANSEYVDKWLPLAENKRPNIETDEIRNITAGQIQDIYMDIVEPACRLTGRTKTRVKRDDMPMFVQNCVREGVFPYIERMLAEQRSAIKRKMAEASEAIERLLQRGVPESDKRVVDLRRIVAKCNTEQLVKKLIMNSIYGTYASLFASKFALAESVTDMGRYLIEQSVCFVDTIVTPYLGFMGNMVSVYGDTDSVFAMWTDYEMHEDQTKLMGKVRNWPVTEIELRGAYAQQYGTQMAMVAQKSRRCVEIGNIVEKEEPKVRTLLGWWKILSTCFKDTDRQTSVFYVSRRKRADDYAPIEFDDGDERIIRYLCKWYRCMVEDLMMCKIDDDIEQAEWIGLKRSPNPPALPSSGKIPTPSDIHDTLEWISAQIFIVEGDKIGKVLNGVYERQYNGCIVQEFEKFYMRLLMTRKKKYGGQKYEPYSSGAKCDITGLTCVRGDSYPLRSVLCGKLVEIAVREGDVTKVQDEALNTLRRVAKREVPPYMLIQSKGVKKDLSEYGHIPQPPGLDHLVPVVGMPPHIAGAIERHLVNGDPLPLVDTRFSFLVVDCHGKNIPVSKRIRTPLEVLRSNGRIMYDTKYYSKNLATLIANMLGPVFDRSPFSERYAQAERFRRTRDKEERSKIVSKYYEDMRKRALMKLISFSKYGAMCTNKNNASYYATGTGSAAASSSSSNDDSIEVLADAMDNMDIQDIADALANDISESLNISTAESDQTSSPSFFHAPIVDNEYKRCVDDMIEAVDRVSSITIGENDSDSVVMAIDLAQKKKADKKSGVVKKIEADERKRQRMAKARGDSMHDDSSSIMKQTNVMSFFSKVEGNCAVCGKPNQMERLCTVCTRNKAKAKRIEEERSTSRKRKIRETIKSAQNQSGILRFARQTAYECFSCGKPNQKEQFCDLCVVKGKAVASIDLVTKSVANARLKECNMCSSTCGSGDLVSSRQNNSIEDIEDITESFYETNPLISNCEQVVCPNRWERAASSRRIEIIGRIDSGRRKTKKREPE
jgi:DNA polymerase elongation subunit (family B)